MRKSNGPRIEPCGTPVKISLDVEVWFWISTNCFLSSDMIWTSLLQHHEVSAF